MRFAKKNIKLVLIGLFVLVSIPHPALAEDLSADKKSIIEQNCTSSQFILDQLRKRDAVARINRGRLYDQLAHQISALNSRFANNKISTPDLAPPTSDLQSGIDRFRAAYDHYYDDVINAINVDCKSKPVDFYQFVINARADRVNIATEISKIDEQLTKYRDALVHYQTSQLSSREQELAKQ